MIRVSPRNIFLVHGDIEASQWFKTQLDEKLPSCNVTIPEPTKIYDIELD